MPDGGGQHRGRGSRLKPTCVGCQHHSVAAALHGGNAYNSVTETTLLSEAEAPAASLTVTVIVKLRGKMIT